MLRRPSLEVIGPAAVSQGSFLPSFLSVHMLPGGLTCHEHLSVSPPHPGLTAPMVLFLDMVFPVLSFYHLIPSLCPHHKPHPGPPHAKATLALRSNSCGGQGCMKPYICLRVCLVERGPCARIDMGPYY